MFRLHEWVLLYTYRKFIETVQNYGLFRCRHRYINFITRRQDTSRTEARIQFHYLVDRRAKRWRANCTWMPSKLYLDDVKIVPGWCQNCTWMMSKLYLDDVYDFTITCAFCLKCTWMMSQMNMTKPRLGLKSRVLEWRHNFAGMTPKMDLDNVTIESRWRRKFTWIAS
jgi:hypothetical protein